MLTRGRRRGCQEHAIKRDGPQAPRTTLERQAVGNGSWKGGLGKKVSRSREQKGWSEDRRTRPTPSVARWRLRGLLGQTVCLRMSGSRKRREGATEVKVQMQNAEYAKCKVQSAKCKLDYKKKAREGAFVACRDGAFLPKHADQLSLSCSYRGRPAFFSFLFFSSPATLCLVPGTCSSIVLCCRLQQPAGVRKPERRNRNTNYMQSLLLAPVSP